MLGGVRDGPAGLVVVPATLPVSPAGKDLRQMSVCDVCACGCANVYVCTTAQTPIPGVEESAVVDWNGVTVGLLGIAEDWLSLCGKLNENELVYVDMCDVAQRISKELRERGAEVVVCLTHSTTAADR